MLQVQRKFQIYGCDTKERGVVLTDDGTCGDRGEHAYKGQLIDGHARPMSYFFEDLEPYEEDTGLKEHSEIQDISEEGDSLIREKKEAKVSKKLVVSSKPKSKATKTEMKEAKELSMGKMKTKKGINVEVEKGNKKVVTAKVEENKVLMDESANDEDYDDNAEDEENDEDGDEEVYDDDNELEEDEEDENEEAKIESKQKKIITASSQKVKLQQVNTQGNEGN